MDDDKLDPESERELSDTLDKAIESAREDGLASMASYMRKSYDAYRKEGFTRKQSFSFTVLLFQNLLRP